MNGSPRPGVIERYREFLPVSDATPRLTIGEGDTPLVRAASLERRLGSSEVWLKLEGCNPTGSFKDRGLAMAAAKAIEEDAHSFICASTGNTAASAAAFGARSSIPTGVIIPARGVALGKVAQALIYGACVVPIQGTFDDGLALVRELAARPGVALVNSVNPYRLEGQQTAAFEVVDTLGDAPDELYVPVGNAGNITAYWKGFRAYQAAGRSTQAPVMHGVQAAGAAPIVDGQPVPHPDTVASAIRIGNPANWERAVQARDESDGTIEAVSDDGIVEAYRLLAAEEGIFVELASAASVAGLLQRARGGEVIGERVVCVLTGTGLKDPGAAVRYAPEPAEVEASIEAVAQALGWSTA